MNATKKLTLALALALGSSQVLALGLGQIRVKSALNQPLRAEIPVRVDNAGELHGLQVALASPEDFARVGLNLSRMDVPLKFKLVRHGDAAVIEVSTEQPVGEPALDFLIEVNWANGKLLREYSVLLDPPATAPVASPAARTPAAAASPARTSPATTTAATPAHAAVVSGNTAAPAAGASPAIAAGGTRTVAAGDTLWRIASEAGGGEDVDRMMLAIQRANPQAFIDDNINTIRRGAVLRIPSRDEVTRISSAQAHAEVRRQMDQWRASHAAAPSVLAQAGGSTPTGTANGATASGGSHLELVPPGDAGSNGEGRSGVEGGTGSAVVTGLKQELARTKESLASEQQKSEDLAGRVKSLEDINGKNQRLLDLKNSEIAELQSKLAEASRAASTAVAPTVAEAPGVAASTGGDIWGEGATPAAASSAEVAAAGSAGPAVAGTVAALADGSVAAASSTPSAAVPEASEPAATSPAVAKPTQPEPAIEPAEAAPPWYMRPITWLIAGLALLALLLLGFLSRRRKPTVAPEAVADTAPAAGDYGDDSEDEYALIDELEQHPDELSLHLELASLYYAHRDQSRFEAAAERMHAYVDDPQQPEWQQVRAMGEELCPDHPLFGALPEEDVLAEQGDDTPDVAPANGIPATSPTSNRGYNFDFDLTPSTVPPAPAEPEEIDFGDDNVFEDALGTPAPADEPSTVEAALSTDDIDDFGSFAGDGDGGHVDDEGFSSDPVDTKLDLARAYQEMGDAEGARAMLEEVLQEGSAAQKDTARKLLDDLR